MSSNRNHWSNIQERGSFLGMSILMWSYKFLGRKLLWIVLFPVVLYFYATSRSTRSASQEFMTRVAAATPYFKNRGQLTTLKHVCSFADSAFDKIDAWLGKISQRDIVYNDASIFPKLVEQKQGAVFIGSHLGNLEVCRALSQLHNKAVINVLVFTENAVKFNKALERINADVSINLIQVSDLNPAMAIHLKEKTEQGEFVVIVGDRTSVSQSGRVIYQDFLGAQAPFSQGPFILAALMEVPIFWLFCLKDKAKYRVIFEPVGQSLPMNRKNRARIIENLVREYARRLAYYACLYPYQWYNFYSFWQQDEDVSRHQEIPKKDRMENL
ncbi:LpxL/LpxP family acyltransferase [Thalassotalea litorea]|uniref:LpxL/LpxP family acyltransferase n=1 Tax=Thalassotalea litorea TaxID=2020715 RepID=UPI0037360C50